MAFADKEDMRLGSSKGLGDFSVAVGEFDFPRDGDKAR